MELNNLPDNTHNKCKTVKIPLKHVIRDFDINGQKILDAVNNCNKIFINTLMFMKLYFISHYEINLQKFRIIDRKFVVTCAKVLCKKKSDSKMRNNNTIELKDTLSKFYNQYYKPYINTCDYDLDNKKLNGVLNYLADSIVTMYNN